MSIVGLAGSPGTEVEPTWSIRCGEVAERRRSSPATCSKRTGHIGSGSATPYGRRAADPLAVDALVSHGVVR